MAIRRKKHLAGGSLAVAGAVLLAGTAAAQPAAAVDLPHAPVAYFSAGSDLTGRQTPADTGNTGCQNLPQPALSAVNFTTSDIEVYYHHDCFPGLPGKPGDWHFGLGSLHWANFTYPALSYKTVH
ncbi:hypothetical protein AF335_09365 [Streptomyces eurocidicus]|uniref:Uncharacterized protein n=1 Tax=Streptomyces eurocidicus TaxID=66423 RepID=A0A2N8P123_STREU|nr:hypothetical protein [Streptomyces eurocidicus]MBB5121858.1 hypothetical protein [Streptomyces eurocidicus]MBF6056195.1 hypothetical protein [Streptomyces eurocidicus]PNE34709.1 hypothetical protein AF335_09365 [Streptomyces eurocidicus]